MFAQPIQLDPNHSVNTAADSTPEQAQLNTHYAVQAQVDKYNASKLADYDAQWNSYVQQKNERPDANNIIAPVPAYAEMVMIDERGWPYIQPSPSYVTPMRAWVRPNFGQSTVGFSGLSTPFGGPSTPTAEPFPGLGLGDSVTLPSGRRFVRIA